MRISAVVTVLALAFLAGACAEMDDTAPERITESVVVTSPDGTDFIITIDYDATLGNDIATYVFDNIAIVSDDSGAGVGLADEPLTPGMQIPAGDPRWDMEDMAINVDVEVGDVTMDLYQLDYRWEWIDVTEIEGFCPPGH